MKKVFNAIYIFAMTAIVQSDEIAKRGSTAAGVITKPCDSMQLTTEIRQNWAHYHEY